MGVLLMWDKPTPDAVYENTEIYRSSTETGTYSLIDKVTLEDTSYYDKTGTGTNWYKIRFITTVSGGSASEYSEPIEGSSRILYCEPADVMRIAGFSEATMHATIDTNTLYKWILEVSSNIEKLMKTVYGRTESFEEVSSSRYLNSRYTLQLVSHRNISDVTVAFRSNIVPPLAYQTKREGYDYEYEPVAGKIHLFTLPIVGMPYDYNNIKITGKYGVAEIPEGIKQIVAILSAIRIFIHITGGSYNDATSYSLGEFSEAFGEPYTNLRASAEILEKERVRVCEQIGLPLKQINMRFS